MNRLQPGVPAYTQLAEQLKARIGRGEFKPGARMPSEQDLVADTCLSRVTFRAAVNMRARDGWLVLGRLAVGIDGRPLEYDVRHYHSGRYMFSVTVPRRKLTSKPTALLDLETDDRRLKLVPF